MDEGLREEGIANKIMTVVKNVSSSYSCSERLIQVNQYNCQDEEISITGQQDAERNHLCCADRENSHALRIDLCRLSSADTEGIGDEIQRSAVVRNKDFPRDMTLKLCGEEEIINGTAVFGAGTGPKSNSETSFVHTDTPFSDLTKPICTPQALCDEETARKAREEGRVDVVFPGIVTQDGCCRFVCELLKCVLYQRQQLPMTYDQMVFFQKQQHTSTQPEDTVVRKPAKPSGGMNWHRGQRTLQELNDMLVHLEALFSLSRVPRVLFMLGGTVLLPSELYEVNMEALVVGGGDGSLRTSSCLRQLFRALFVADLLSDVKPVRLMATTVMALGHRECGVTGFKPKLDFRVPNRVKRQVISLSCETSVSGLTVAGTGDWDDYIWFQAPVTVKGFCK